MTVKKLRPIANLEVDASDTLAIEIDRSAADLGKYARTIAFDQVAKRLVAAEALVENRGDPERSNRVLHLMSK